MPESEVDSDGDMNQGEDMYQAIRSARATIREIFDLIWTQATPFVKRRIIVVLVLVLLSAVLAPLGPLALKLIVDRLSGEVNVGSLAIGVLVTLYVLSQWLSRSVGEIRGLVYARAERRMLSSISERVFDHIMRLPLRFHLQRATGGVNQTLENGLQGYQLIVHHLVFTALPVAAQLVTTAWILSRLGRPVFFLIFCAAVVCYATAFALFVVKVAKAAEEASAAHVEANATMTDSILNYETVKFFTAEAVVRHKVRGALNNTEESWVRFYRRYAINGLVVASIFASFLALTVAIATRDALGGRMTVGEFVLVNTYILQMMQPIEMLGYAVQGLSQGAAMLSKMLALLREKVESSEPTPALTLLPVEAAPVASAVWKSRQSVRDIGARRATDAGEYQNDVLPAELEFRNVSLSYGDNRAVLKDVSFLLPAGNTLAIVGGSGAGKSTLVRLLVRLFEPGTGTILLDGVPTSELSLPELRGAIAVVPQDTVVFNDSIGYNIGFGRFGSTQKDIEEAAQLAHLHEFIAKSPEGYDTRVGERGVKLSGGERQRISIARAAIKKPRLFVFDEATSSLDSATEREILRNLRTVARATTTLIIAHRLSTVVHADQIVVLRDGAITERGTHAQLLAGHDYYASLWETQQSGDANAPVRSLS
ncbi:MAG: ATP-binding cassette domain-containing protein [Gammaproteobacteria bacterium]